MNSKQLRKYRKNFYVNLENFIKENNSLTMEDYHIIIGKTISQCEKEIKTSKKVYVYMGTYKKTEEELSLIDEIDENDDSIYNIYCDIESSQSIKVKLKNIKDFEKNNKIINPKIDFYSMEEINKKYNTIRFEYYKNLLNDSQKSVYKLIKMNNE